MVEILKLMLDQISSSESRPRFVFELVIRTQPSGPLCLWQCFFSYPCYWLGLGREGSPCNREMGEHLEMFIHSLCCGVLSVFCQKSLQLPKGRMHNWEEHLVSSALYEANTACSKAMPCRQKQKQDKLFEMQL